MGNWVDNILSQLKHTFSMPIISPYTHIVPDKHDQKTVQTIIQRNKKPTVKKTTAQPKTTKVQNTKVQSVTKSNSTPIKSGREQYIDYMQQLNNDTDNLDNYSAPFTRYGPKPLNPSYINVNNLRVLSNDSPTQQASELIENSLVDGIANPIRVAEDKGHNPRDYYMAWDKEIKVPGYGRVSKSILDSLAQASERAGTPMMEGLGIGWKESHWGAIPNNNFNDDAIIDDYSRKLYNSVPNFFKNEAEYKNKAVARKKTRRAAYNSSVAKNFGGIDAQSLVNNHEYATRGWELSDKYRPLLEHIESPLQHMFTMYNLGIANRGQPDYVPLVKGIAKDLEKNPVIQEWLKGYNKEYHNK